MVVTEDVICGEFAAGVTSGKSDALTLIGVLATSKLVANLPVGGFINMVLDGTMLRRGDENRGNSLLNRVPDLVTKDESGRHRERDRGRHIAARLRQGMSHARLERHQR